MNKKSITIIIGTIVVIACGMMLKHHFTNHDIHSNHNKKAIEHAITEETTSSIEWTPSTHAALINEMKGITVNYQNLVSSLVQGDWDDVVAQSQAIHSSFILKQELSEEELHDLHRILPKRFIEMDSQFHDHAKKLAMAAKQHDSELATFYSGKLLEGCVNCHKVYARERFTNFDHIINIENH